MRLMLSSVILQVNSKIRSRAGNLAHCVQTQEVVFFFIDLIVAFQNKTILFPLILFLLFISDSRYFSPFRFSLDPILLSPPLIFFKAIHGDVFRCFLQSYFTWIIVPVIFLSSQSFLLLSFKHPPPHKFQLISIAHFKLFFSLLFLYSFSNSVLYISFFLSISSFIFCFILRFTIYLFCFFQLFFLPSFFFRFSLFFILFFLCFISVFSSFLCLHLYFFSTLLFHYFIQISIVIITSIVFLYFFLSLCLSFISPMFFFLYSFLSLMIILYLF